MLYSFLDTARAFRVTPFHRFRRADFFHSRSFVQPGRFTPGVKVVDHWALLAPGKTEISFRSLLAASIIILYSRRDVSLWLFWLWFEYSEKKVVGIII